MRIFPSGATRDDKTHKRTYSAYFSPLAMLAYGDYMLHHEQTELGRREPDNWKKGIPQKEFFNSLGRHYIDLWLHMEGFGHLARHSMQDALCAIIFNSQGLLHEYLKEIFEG